MREFISLRDVRVAGRNGLVVLLKAGRPRKIPASLEATALGLGCVPYDPNAQIVPLVVTPEGSEKLALLKDVCRQLIAANREEDFTNSGVPRTSAARELTDFEFSAAELAQAWDDLQSELDSDGESDEE